MDISAAASLASYTYQTSLKGGATSSDALQAAFGQIQGVQGLTSTLLPTEAGDLVSFSETATELASLYSLAPEDVVKELGSGGASAGTSLTSTFGDGSASGFSLTDPTVAGAYAAYQYQAAQKAAALDTQA